MKLLGLGSCRIHNPLMRVARGEVQYLNALFGKGAVVYVHAPNEMRQFVRLVKGEMSLPAEVSKYAFIETATKITPELSRYFNEADAVVLEICTNKEFSFGDYALSINELARNTIERGGPAVRQWWQTVGSGRRPDDSTIAAAKKELVSANPEFHRIDELLLRELKYERLSAAQMKDKVAELVRLLNRPVLIVPHIRARTAAGDWIEDRNLHVSMVLEVARDLNLQVLDPLTFVERDGQARVLAKQGLDFNHYAEDYLDVVGTALVAASGKVLARNREPAHAH